MNGLSLTVLPSVDSTNNYAMALAHDGKAVHGDAFTAIEQTAGKGQRGRQWHAAAHQSLAISVVLQPPLPISNQFLVSACVATAARRLLAGYHPGCTIKWPNDLYYNDRKAGGILIENIIRGQNWLFAVAGAGLNINQTAFPPHLPNPVSLWQLTGCEQNITSLAVTFCQVLGRQWQLMLTQPEQIMMEYREHLYKKDETVRLKKDNHVFEATLLDVSRTGQLITAVNGITTTFSFGEAEWLIPASPAAGKPG